MINFLRHPCAKILSLFVVLSLLIASDSSAAVWQWSVPVPSLEGRRAYLWISPDCPKVRGVIVACQNMLEEPLFDRAAFRAAAAENGLAILLVFSGHDKGPDDDKNPDHPPRSSLDIFLNPTYPKGNEDPAGAGKDLQKALDDLAEESGYDELRNAPIMPVGHSSAGSFVWHLYRWNPSRIFAMMPFKTGAKNDGPTGIPIFDVNSEWFEYGNSDMHNVGFSGPDGGVNPSQARSHDKDSLYGYYVDVGGGHCDVSDDSMSIVRLFLKKAVAARIPDDAPMDGPVSLKPVVTESGWLIDPATFGKPEGKATSYNSYAGDPHQALWYLDEEMADAVQSHIVAQLAKKPQQIGFLKDGQPSTDARMFVTGATLLDDDATFKMQADYVDHIDHANYGKDHPDYYPADTKLEHSNAPILYRVNSGGLVQIAPDTFRVCPRAGPLLPQGNPWEPTVVAYSLGNDQFRPAEHPAHININIVNTEGQMQTLDFPKIADLSSMNLAPVKLAATASSGLPVEYFMVSGPASIDGDTLTFDKIPMRAKYPIRIMVSSFQWGRTGDEKVQSAGPITQDFFIQK